MDHFSLSIQNQGQPAPAHPDEVEGRVDGMIRGFELSGLVLAAEDVLSWDAEARAAPQADHFEDDHLRAFVQPGTVDVDMCVYQHPYEEG